MTGLNLTTLEQLAEFNQKTFRYRIPALVFLGLMAPLGILGNAAVIYIYGFRLDRSNVYLFITLLAVSDMISCVICIPMEMYYLFVFYNYLSIASCKFSGFLTFACYICSALMLLVISVERYVKVCRSMGTQVSMKMAKILAGAVFFVSSLLASPVAVSAEPFIHTLEDGTILQVCTYNDKDEQWYYSIALIVFLLCVFGAMSTLYWRVIKTSRSHVKWCQQRRVQTSNADVMNDCAQMSKSAAEIKMLHQTNRTVIWISAVYVASCIPTFLMAGVSKFLSRRKPESSVNFLVFLLIQSWALNCTLNPVVYGFLNSKFRTELRTIFNLNLVRTKFSSVEKSEGSNQTSSTGTL